MGNDSSSFGAGPRRAILVVDDDEFQRELLRRTLEQAGWAVVTAEDGLGALAEFRARRFDLVISDIMMGEMDGLSLMRSVLDERPETKILALSGLRDRDDLIELARECGAQGALRKPVAPAALVASVRLLLAA